MGILPALGNYSAMGGRDVVHARAAYVGLFGQDPAEALGLIDADGKQLDCSNGVNYTITFPANQPQINVTQPGFWSVTVYEFVGFLVSNSINRYKIGSNSYHWPLLQS